HDMPPSPYTTLFRSCLFAGSGIPEMIASLLAMKHGTLPPTLNFKTPDPACPVQVLTKARPIAKPYFVKVSSTEFGQCAAVECKRPEEHTSELQSRSD